jgi:hypothetical protein
MFWYHFTEYALYEIENSWKVYVSTDTIMGVEDIGGHFNTDSCIELAAVYCCHLIFLQ